MEKNEFDRGDGRDEKGRWIGSGNLNGRPKKVPDYDMSDFYNFSQSTMEIGVGGKNQTVTRQEALILKSFETAMKGNRSAQKYLMDKFEEAELSRGFVQLRVDQMVERYYDDPSSISEEDFRLMETAMASLKRHRSTLRMKNP